MENAVRETLLAEGLQNSRDMTTNKRLDARLEKGSRVVVCYKDNTNTMDKHFFLCN